MLRGKGLWVYREGELDLALQIAPRIGATHILCKVGQGSTYYSGVRSMAQQITAAGLTPMGWMWLLLDDPQAEAQVAVRAFQDGFRGFVFDTEADQCRKRFDRAVRLGEYIQVAGLDLDKIYNCSFPNISHHRDLPYDQMNEYCKGGLMSMSYGTFFAPGDPRPPEQQARIVIDEWTYGHYVYWSQRWGYSPPLYPVLAPYRDEYGQSRMGRAEFQIWLDRLEKHNPSFISIFRAGVINSALFPLIRNFALGDVSAPIVTDAHVQVVSPMLGYLNVRPQPSTALPPIARVNDGVTLTALEPEADVQAKVGQPGQWLKIRTPARTQGYVAAWYLRLIDGAPKIGIQVQVVSPEVGYLNIRPTPGTQRPPLTRVDHGAVMDSLEPEEVTRTKLGQQHHWLYVRTPEGIEGYAYAWYLGLHTETATGEAIAYVTVQSHIGLNVRQGPGTNTPVIWRVGDKTVLEVRENPHQVEKKLGKDAWVKVRTPSHREGYVSGVYLRAKRLADKRQPVGATALPKGESAWLFGIHGATADGTGDFRHLFQGTGKTGWVLFTQTVGTDPFHGSGHDVSKWSDSGFGVIIRLNHAYEPAGTLPVRSEYHNFARACARYVQNSKGCHIWVIANEQNNVREHPGGAVNPVEHITPQMYAEAFNLTWRQIKAVQPNAIVVPGAVDPYNTYPWARMGGKRYRPLDYFKEMLDHIVELDGISLHTYTHWMDVDLITKPTIFQDEFLKPGTVHEHYYDFQAYRPFAEVIPDKWRDKPIYITESNHWLALEHQPQNPHQEQQVGWVNKDKGWVEAAYREINQWNQRPHAQQIHCLLLYRWTGDAWAIEHKGEIHKDLRDALRHDFRWRR